MIKKNRSTGFTLIEILIALFIFTILSLILTGALNQIMSVDRRAAENAARVRDAQMALIRLERDIGQAVNRKILNETDHEMPALIGTPRSLTLTHLGYANPLGQAVHSSLERTRYQWDKEGLTRTTWDQLDLTPHTLPHTRYLLHDVKEARFQYLNKQGRLLNYWSESEAQGEPLPTAIKITFTINNWGQISQLYVITAKPNPNEVPSQLAS